MAKPTTYLLESADITALESLLLGAGVKIEPSPEIEELAVEIFRELEKGEK